MNHGPIDLQSIALPLSYTPTGCSVSPAVGTSFTRTGGGGGRERRGSACSEQITTTKPSKPTHYLENWKKGPTIRAECERRGFKRGRKGERCLGDVMQFPPNPVLLLFQVYWQFGAAAVSLSLSLSTLLM